jgi:hypothetical protein
VDKVKQALHNVIKEKRTPYYKAIDGEEWNLRIFKFNFFLSGEILKLLPRI